MKSVLTVFDSVKAMREYLDMLKGTEAGKHGEFMKVNLKNSRVSYYNGVTEYCVVLKKDEDYLKLQGTVFSHVTFMGKFSEFLTSYVHSRMKERVCQITNTHESRISLSSLTTQSKLTIM